MPTFEQINVIGDILNSSWGRSASNTFECKASLQGEELHVMYSTVVYFASESSIGQQMPMLSDESNTRIKDLVSHTKSEYKARTGETLGVKELLNRDGLELVQASMVTPRKVAIYRRKVSFALN